MYGLLLSPDTHEPLDSTLALSYFESSGRRRRARRQHARAAPSLRRSLNLSPRACLVRA